VSATRPANGRFSLVEKHRKLSTRPSGSGRGGPELIRLREGTRGTGGAAGSFASAGRAAAACARRSISEIIGGESDSEEGGDDFLDGFEAPGELLAGRLQRGGLGTAKQVSPRQGAATSQAAAAVEAAGAPFAGLFSRLASCAKAAHWPHLRRTHRRFAPHSACCASRSPPRAASC
jgi:hypothetical protein